MISMCDIISGAEVIFFYNQNPFLDHYLKEIFIISGKKDLYDKNAIYLKHKHSSKIISCDKNRLWKYFKPIKGEQLEFNFNG
jgi:hypothetical protein